MTGIGFYKLFISEISESAAFEAFYGNNESSDCFHQSFNFLNFSKTAAMHQVQKLKFFSKGKPSTSGVKRSTISAQKL